MTTKKTTSKPRKTSVKLTRKKLSVSTKSDVVAETSSRIATLEATLRSFGFPERKISGISDEVRRHIAADNPKSLTEEQRQYIQYQDDCARVVTLADKACVIMMWTRLCFANTWDLPFSMFPMVALKPEENDTLDTLQYCVSMLVQSKAHFAPRELFCKYVNTEEVAPDVRFTDMFAKAMVESMFAECRRFIHGFVSDAKGRTAEQQQALLNQAKNFITLR